MTKLREPISLPCPECKAPAEVSCLGTAMHVARIMACEALQPKPKAETPRQRFLRLREAGPREVTKNSFDSDMLREARLAPKAAAAPQQDKTPLSKALEIAPRYTTREARSNLCSILGRADAGQPVVLTDYWIDRAVILDFEQFVQLVKDAERFHAIRDGYVRLEK